MSNIVCHIGLHKTASGTLQRQFFPACHDLNLLTTRDPVVQEFMHDVTRKDPLYFDPNKTRALLESKISGTKINLLSNESLSGPPYAGVVEWGLDHRSPILGNLRRVLPNARVVIVLRRQDSLARSLYRQYIKRGGTAKIHRFYGLDGSGRPALMSLDRFYFSPFLREIHTQFAGGVLVLTFEEFVQDQRTFLDRLCTFIGIATTSVELRKENATRLGYFGIEVTRRMNFAMRGMLNHGVIPALPIYRHGRWSRVSAVELIHDYWPGRPRSKQISPLLDAGEQILRRFGEDNRMMDRELGLGLGRFKYY